MAVVVEVIAELETVADEGHVGLEAVVNELLAEQSSAVVEDVAEPATAVA